MKLIKVKRDGKVLYLKSELEIQEGDEGAEEVETPAGAGEDEESLKVLEEKIFTKIEAAVRDIRENPVQKSPVYRKEEATIEKSVIETDPYLRSKRPFVKLSKRMEDFVTNVKAMARGDYSGYQKALQEDNATEGGFTVPEEFQGEVVRYLDESTVVRGRARVFNMTRDVLRLPKLDQSSTVFGGFSFNAVDEEGAATEDSSSFGTILLRAKKVVGLTYISSELLEDSAVNIANFMVTLMGEALADYEDTKFLKGTGMGEALGITVDPGVNVVTRETSTRITYDDVVNMWQNTLSTFDKDAVWITNKAGVEQLALINKENTGGLLMWMPNLREGIPGTVLGKPLLVTERVQSLGTRGDIVYGNLKFYFIGDRGGIKVDTSIHNKFENDQVTLRMIKRFDGLPAVATAFTTLRE